MDWLGISMKLIFGVILGSLLLAAGIKLFQQLSRLSSSQKSRFIYMVVGSLVSGLIVIVAADTYARITVANEPISHAIHECLHYLLIQPIGSALLLFPFAAIGWIAANFSKDGRQTCGYCLLIGGFLPAIYQYFSGYMGIQRALLKHAWTAAALSNGFMPFYSLLFIGGGMIIVFVVCGLIERSKI